MRRPDVFTLDYSHPLAQGLVFAWLGQRQDALQDYSLLCKRGMHKNGAFGYFDTGIGRSAASFDGANDYAEIVHNGDLSVVTDQFTVSTWVYPRSLKTYGHAGGVWQRYYFPLRNTALGLGFVVWEGVTERTAWSNYQLPLNTWHRITGIVRGTSLELYLGVDLIASTTRSGTLASGGTTLFTPGSYSLDPGNASYCLDGSLSDWMYWPRRALSPAEIALLADRTDPMLGGLIVEERPVLYFDMGGSTTHDLTAASLVVGSPVLGSPAVGQVHALAASGLTTTSPTLGTPALAQVHALTATGLTTSAPVLGAPAVGQAHALTATNFAAGSPVLGSPAIGQKHALTASGLTVSAPVLGTPSLVENENPVDALTANDLVVGSPVLGTPSLGQIHVLGSDGLVTGSPVLGSPSITQIHTLEALGLTVGVPVLGTPALNGSDIVLIPPDEVRARVVLQARTRKVILDARNRRAAYGA